MFACFVLIFPLVGTALLLIPTLLKRRKLRLLREGEFTFAKVTKVQRTSMTVNNEQRYWVHAEFEVGGEPQTSRTAAYGNDVELARRRLDEGENLGVLYDPKKPSQMLFTGRLLDNEWI